MDTGTADQRARVLNPFAPPYPTCTGENTGPDGPGASSNGPVDPARTAAVAAAFSLGTPAGPVAFVARGSMGELWRLRTVEGASWAVKTPFAWADPEASGRDVVLQDAAAAAGIRLPAPRRSLDGRIVVDGVRVYEWIDLVPLPSSPDEATLEEVGRILGTLHALALPPAPGEEVDDWYRSAPALDVLPALADAGRRVGRAWAEPLRQRLALIDSLGTLVRVAPPRTDDVIVCHRDFTADNVFQRVGGGPLVVLDWENAGPLSAEAELAATVATWCASSSPDALLAGYAAGGGTATISGSASFATNVATRLNYLRVMAEQSLADDVHRPFADAAVEGLLRVGLDAALPRGWAP